MGSPANAAAAPGQASADPYGLEVHGYQVLIFLGHGATGSVYKAKYIGAQARGDLQPGQLVALKFVKAEKVNPREVLTQARMQHMNIVRIFDVLACAPH